MYKRVTLISFAACVLAASTASAALIGIDANARRSYNSAGALASGPGNYLTGELNTFGIPDEYRSFFIFDLSGVTDPIVSATFVVTMTNYGSTDPSETFSLFDISTPLNDIVSGAAGVAGFNDLGSGTVYGTRPFTAADPPIVPVNILLNGAALAALNASAGGAFGMGGAITTIIGTSDQFLFGGTSPTPIYVTRLVLETQPVVAPEPSMLLLIAGGGGLFLRWRARSSRPRA